MQADEIYSPTDVGLAVTQSGMGRGHVSRIAALVLTVALTVSACTSGSPSPHRTSTSATSRSSTPSQPTNPATTSSPSPPQSDTAILRRTVWRLEEVHRHGHPSRNVAALRVHIEFKPLGPKRVTVVLGNCYQGNTPAVTSKHYLRLTHDLYSIAPLGNCDSKFLKIPPLAPDILSAGTVRWTIHGRNAVITRHGHGSLTLEPFNSTG